MIENAVKARGKSDMFISVIIPTYNRAEQVVRSVQSALTAFSGCVAHEIIVVDDASTDNTQIALQAAYTPRIESRDVKIVVNAANLGVTGSRNKGYGLARGEWAVFLDSDDEFIGASADAAVRALVLNRHRPIVFFRCEDERNRFVGTPFDRDVELDLKTYLEHTSHGEVLVVLNKRLVASPPFMENLRGYEGLSLCRIIREHGPALLSGLTARRYNRSGSDRLSAFHGFLRRMPLLARGHLILVREFKGDMSIKRIIGCLLKAAVYWTAGSVYRVFHQKGFSASCVA